MNVELSDRCFVSEAGELMTENKAPIIGIKEFYRRINGLYRIVTPEGDPILEYAFLIGFDLPDEKPKYNREIPPLPSWMDHETDDGALV
jgi:hypothetical protein